ncbi:MAG: single-stranded-DNA-specific exonuclease RecJ [Planctomycetota bacterium]|jgi:single-stranded-DNA-specific exonuclease
MERSLSFIPEPDRRERALAKTLKVPDLMARVLLARGLDDPDRARQHLKPDLRRLHDPFSFAHMERAVERIHQAIRQQEKILVHGDYDVDGVTGTVLLLKFFALMEADVHPFIPARDDGYSFTHTSVDAVRNGGFGLCISVDNGTNAGSIIDKIQGLGCDVIVTDHHGTQENVANAHTVLNPRLADAGYPDQDLAGVGVAFCLATAVARSFSRGKTLSAEFRNFLVEAMVYVALGTIADVAPLRGENRILVSHGLRAIAASRNPGIRALIDCAGLSERGLSVDDIAFRVAPLINAAGRMGHALEAVHLLMAPGFQEAQEAASVLEKHNHNRRRVERSLADQVMEHARDMPDDVLVLSGEGWHRGVLGIVASRVAEQLLKPTLLLSLENGVGRGSGRSAGGFDLRAALAGCADLLTSYGGHRAAVGLELPASRVDALRQELNRAADHDPTNSEPQQVDGQVDFDELDPRLVRQLDQLGPFGQGNPRPTFVTTNVKLVGNPTVDTRGLDLRIRVAQNGVVLPGRLRLGASMFETLRNHKEPVTLVHSPRLAHWAEEGPVVLHASHLVHAATPHNPPHVPGRTQ